MSRRCLLLNKIHCHGFFSRDAVLSYIDQETEWGPTYAYQQCTGGFRDVTGLDGMRI